MKKLGVVLQYELMTYIKNKSYVISTVVIAVIAAAIMFVPRFIDISAITGITNSTEQNSGDSDSDKDMLMVRVILIKIIKQTIIKM